ncbi:MAG: DUF3011 domain-containing protein [Arenimonas sp.]
MKINFILALVMAVAASMHSEKVEAGAMECSSLKAGFIRCSLPHADKMNVRIIRQYSKAPCNRDYTWGADSDGIWVDKGCRASFAYVDNYSSNNYGGYHPARNGDGNPFKSGTNEFEYYQDGYHEGLGDGHNNQSMYCGRHEEMYDRRFESAFCQGYEAGWKKARL